MKKTSPIRLFFLALLPLSLEAVSAANYYVSPMGRDSYAGTLASPLATITNAYNKAVAGDTIYLRGGTYRQQVTLAGSTAGNSNNLPITLTAYPGEKPVISGLDVLSLTWRVTNNPTATNNPTNVWVASYTAPTNSYTTSFPTLTILQLFYKGKPMLNARWPNCPTNADGSWNFFSPNTWAYSGSNSTYGTMSDTNLTNLPSNSINGAMAVLNVAHQYYTWTRMATNYDPVANSFTYSTYGTSSSTTIPNVQSFTDDCYYLFGQKQFLDAPGEWFYDGTNKLLYFMTPNGTSPTNGVVEVKTRPFGFMATNAVNSYLTVNGISFFGTAFQFGQGIGAASKSTGIVFSSNTVSYSSWTEYLLVNAGAPGAGQEGIFPTMYVNNANVACNTFTNGALNALLIRGLSNTIENNMISDYDISSSLVYPPLQVNLANPYDATNSLAGSDIVRYNNLQRSGGIQMQVTQKTNDVYLNDVTDSFLASYGGNKDSSAVYTQNFIAAGSRIHHNWVQGCYSGTAPLQDPTWGGGIGIRGDDYTCGVTVDHNVTWDLGSTGIQMKNSNNVTTNLGNQVINNTVYNDSAYNPGPNSIIIPNVDAALTGVNTNSVVANNLAVTILNNFAAYNGTTPTQGTTPTSVRLMASNVTPSTQSALTQLLVTASTNLSDTWFDFRPATNATSLINQGSTNTLQIATNLPGISTCTNWPILNANAGTAPDVGAYERGDSVYAIPGIRMAQASYPIVPSGATGIPVSRDVLMWRPAYNAAKHNLYFSTTASSVTSGSRSVLRGVFTGENNVYTLPALSAGTTYYWRVDAVMPNGAIIKGNVWNFRTQ